MITASIDPTFAAWRSKARELLKQGVRPENVNWGDAHTGPGLLLEEPAAYSLPASAEIKVPPDFLSLAARVCAHTDDRRWSILYRLLYRLTLGGERHLLHLPSDPDIRQCEVWSKAIGRDIHKMHAFVRFRLIGQDEESGREQFVAWFEPMFHTVRLAAPFFEKRFAGMDWSILTPDECVHWDGKKLFFTPGMDRSQAPSADAHDDLWRTYYRSIFNPARLKVKAMQSEMPQKYWKNLPEAQIIRELIAGSQDRVQDMLETPERPVKPVPDNAYIRSLHQRPEGS
ncbi:DNA polymerase [Prosthecobacter fusiformis]|uniref:DNA polymerase n=1 Tax=Prosthecobacter fusiformis TaxID=48464 RepID=A0A4R7RMS3_9BACT|nr:TIGR03915 family putative DNA repair protein [Prosthecobacter fusiformis]TDU66088.1 DNA polymerase [Prosthecobacter fusiformis]